MLLKSALPACLLMLTLPAIGAAGVRVMTGPTPIQDGDAKSAGDTTVVNERLAFALAVGSPPPYGVPRGAIVDVAPVVNGKIGRDCVVFADFIPNNWSAWPNTFQRIDVLEHGPRVGDQLVRDQVGAQLQPVLVGGGAMAPGMKRAAADDDPFTAREMCTRSSEQVGEVEVGVDDVVPLAADELANVADRSK